MFIFSLVTIDQRFVMFNLEYIVVFANNVCTYHVLTLQCTSRVNNMTLTIYIFLNVPTVTISRKIIVLYILNTVIVLDNNKTTSYFYQTF